MGAWGPKLYQDDLAEDVRDYYCDLLQNGIPDDEIVATLIREKEHELSDQDDAPVFWFALADIQWHHGRISENVKEKALYYLNNGSDLRRWQAENPESAIVREKVLVELREKLFSPSPKTKKISHLECDINEWQIGDVFALKLKGKKAHENNLLDQYILIQKIGNTVFHPGHTYPIMYAKITKNHVLPQSLREMETLEFVEMYSADWLYGLDDDVDETLLDEAGGLPAFRFVLVRISSEPILDNLIYVGNFDIIRPEIEFIEKDDVSIPSISSHGFEEKMIEKYLDFNLKQAPIFTKKHEL